VLVLERHDYAYFANIQAIHPMPKSTGRCDTVQNNVDFVNVITLYHSQGKGNDGQFPNRVVYSATSGGFPGVERLIF